MKRHARTSPAAAAGTSWASRILRELLRAPLESSRRRTARRYARLVTQLSVAERPITQELPALMRSRAVTYRSLAVITRQVDPAGRGLTHGHIANLASGHERPSRRALELLAAAFALAPGYFAEHRLAELREQLDERRVGFEAAYRRYRTLTRAA